ncbi:unnamed protein product [Prorocentrum cordatum]|uniref:Uncharacterized protein n=1 Tax=Prorocentrum cordatum TaxID=2364126 RepID=A0ABN9TWV8_9DINO|nr:unnamed protein product [Polarella glacialis]
MNRGSSNSSGASPVKLAKCRDKNSGWRMADVDLSSTSRPKPAGHPPSVTTSRATLCSSPSPKRPARRPVTRSRATPACNSSRASRASSPASAASAAAPLRAGSAIAARPWHAPCGHSGCRA